jgi:hypothetical protein
MDPQTQIIAGLIVGYIMQWARGIKKIPDPLVYVGAGLVGLAIFWLATPNAIPAGHVKDFIWSGIAFLFTIRGVAGASADAKVAPKSNSL